MSGKSELKSLDRYISRSYKHRLAHLSLHTAQLCQLMTNLLVKLLCNFRASNELVRKLNYWYPSGPSRTFNFTPIWKASHVLVDAIKLAADRASANVTHGVTDGFQFAYPREVTAFTY